MKHLFLLLFLMFISISIYAQNYDCKIFHSNGSQYFLDIKSVNELGLIDSANNYISYKIIDSLITGSELFLEKVQAVQNVKYSINDDNQFVITFDKSIYKSKDLGPKLIDLHSMLSLNSISFNFLSFQLQYRFSFLSSLYQKVIISGGNTFSNPNYYSLNFGYGVGLRLPISEFDSQLWLNCTTSTLYSTSNGTYSLEDMIQYFISVINYINLNNYDSLQLGIGLNLYINQFVIEDRKPQFSIQVGLNLAL